MIKTALVKYRGYEDFIFNKLYKLYVDEEWVMAPLWFTAKWRYRSDGSRERMTDFYARKA